MARTSQDRMPSGGYSDEFKRGAVRLVTEEGYSIAAAAKAVGVSQPRMQQLCAGDLPLSRYTVSKPDAEKWRRHEAEIEAVMPGLAGIVERLQPIAAM